VSVHILWYKYLRGRAEPGESDAPTLETQHYSDTPHHIGDPHRTSVVPSLGQVSMSKTTYDFTTAGPGFRRKF
jgi:hypothetical protein